MLGAVHSTTQEREPERKVMKDYRIEGDNINSFDYLQNYFSLDLHGCTSPIFVCALTG